MMKQQQELIELAKQRLTDFVNECGCKSDYEVYSAIALMVVVASSVRRVKEQEWEDAQ